MTPPSDQTPSSRRETAAWLIPSLLYVVTVGSVGVTSKLALDHIDWQDLMLWQGIGYAIVVPVLLIRRDARIEFVPGIGWTILSVMFAIGGLVTLYIALATGEASKVVPISASYPAVTLIFSAIFLKERLTAARAVGVLLVIGGVILVTAAS
jgi:transporter family protein